MKKLITILAIAALSKLSAQPTVTNPYLGAPKSITFAQGWLRSDSGILNAVKDTLVAPTRIGEQRFRATDSTLYIARSLTGQKWSAVGSGSSSATVSTLPIIAKAPVDNGLSINFPLVDNGGTSTQLPNYNLSQISTNTISSNFTDGIMAFNLKDSAIFIVGGWNNSPATTDTVRGSTDGGITFSFKSLFPYHIHTAGHVASLDGYFYLMSADYLSTATQQKTVTRTSDFTTFETRTTNAGFGSRILSDAWEWNGWLFVGGGQSDLAATSVFNDIWRSTDGGATWTLWNSSAMAGSDSVMRGNAYNTVVVFNRAIYKITSNIYPATSSKKVYKSLDGGLSWVRIDDYPFSLGVSYPATIVWDGKLWVFGGNNGSNTSNIAYLGKTDTWHIAANYIDVNTSAVITPTHASDLIVYKDKIINPLGNLKNDVWSFFRSKYFPSFVVRDSARFAPLATQIADDTTTYKPVVSNSVGTISAFSSWKGIAPNGFGMAIGNIIGNSPVSGRALYVGSVNQLAISADFTFDSTQKRLGIGLGGGSVSAPLHVKRSTSGEVIREESSLGAGAIGFDANGMYLQPITASMGVWLYNNSGNTILKILAGGGAQLDGASGKLGIGVSPTALIHMKAGTSSANTAPLKFTTGTSLTTAEAGAMEYTTPQLFFTNGGGQRQEIPQIQQSRVSTQFDKTSDVALANVTGLTSTLVAGHVYRFVATLFTSSGSSGGVQFAIGGTATATAIIYEGLTTNAGLTTQSRATALATSVGGVTAVTAALAKIEGTITVNVGGTLTVQFAQNASNGTTSSVLVGSTFVVTEMN